MMKMIMKSMETDDAVSYRIGCGCHGTDHDMDIWAEQDANIHTLMFSVKCNTPYWDSTFESKWLAWLNEPIKRLKVIAKVLFTGKAEYTFDFILEKDNVAALKYALDEIEKKFDK